MNLIDNHKGIPFTQITMQDALNQIKKDIESAIFEKGDKGKETAIRSQRIIKLIHDVVKTEFIIKNVHPSLINPDPLRLIKIADDLAKGNKISNKCILLKDKELKLLGILKTKKQDISIIPSNILVNREIIDNPIFLKGQVDVFGKYFTESVLSVNVRSQLSSVSKNFDTLYERTFAESLNFHLRLPNMVLGEVYMIIVNEYDDAEAKNKKVAFKESNHIEKYILAFQALNNRDINSPQELYKYERVALLIVDFSQTVPKLYNTTQELIADGLLPNGSLAKLDGLSFSNFVDDILNIYQTRFPDNTFNK